MPNPIDMPNFDIDISADFSFYWSFFPITTGTDTSEIYSNNDRYVITQLEDAIGGNTQYQELLMEPAGESDYKSLINDGNVDYLKIELSQGGRSTRTNFHDDALTGGFYIQNNKYFEIIGQEGGHIIDVSKRDITKTATLDPNGSPDYILSQEFAWKAVEWYMADTRRRFLEGTISATNISNKRILVDVLSENSATTYGQGYFNLGAREFISFYERFTEKYSHDINSSPRRVYSKFKGWYTHSTNGQRYAIKNVIIDPERTDGSNYQAIIEFEEVPTDLSVGNLVYTLFDKSPHPRSGSFNGAHLIDVSEVDPGRGVVTVKICLDGFWLSPQFDIPVPSGTRVGLCGGRYWGLGDRAPDNENAILFMRTPAGVLGISSLFHYTSNEDFVLFYDYDLKTLSVRRSSLQFKEYPSKYEISIGPPSKTDLAILLSGSTTTIPLDTSQDRTKTMHMDIPFGDAFMLFSIGELENYYGTIIRGLGKMKLLGFEKTGTPQDAALYKYEDQPVSPIYEYLFGKYSRTRVRNVNLSIKTEDGPIIVSSPSIGVNIDRVQINYVNDNQIIDNASLFDIYEIDDDQLIIFMGRRFQEFRVFNPDETVTKNSNSNSDGTKWSDSSGIFVIGSKDTGTSWGNPIKPFKGDDQLGLLILDSADYCCSIYNGLAEEILIFFIKNDGEGIYLGCLIVDTIKLPYKNFKCIPIGNEQAFLWRPPALESDSPYQKMVDDGYTFQFEDEGFLDEYIIVASEFAAVNPQISVSNVTDFGILSTYVLGDGNMVIFYDSLDGIKILFSSDSGRIWKGSKIIIARNGKSAFYNRGLLVYASSEGIVSKIITETLLTTAFKAEEGSVSPFTEVIQNTFDNQIIKSLNTGDIPTQKLSVHLDEDGAFHVFYYDSNGRLCSSQGTDLGWVTTNNF